MVFLFVYRGEDVWFVLVCLYNIVFANIIHLCYVDFSEVKKRVFVGYNSCTFLLQL